jgi:hypothetical protein
VRSKKTEFPSTSKSQPTLAGNGGLKLATISTFVPDGNESALPMTANPGVVCDVPNQIVPAGGSPGPAVGEEEEPFRVTTHPARTTMTSTRQSPTTPTRFADESCGPAQPPVAGVGIAPRYPQAGQKTTAGGTAAPHLGQYAPAPGD